MSLPHTLLLNMSPLLLCLVMMAVAAVLSIVGILIFHRFVPHRSLRVHNDIAGPIFSTLGVVYAVLLGFMVVVVWQNFDRTKTNVEMEMSCLADLYMNSAAFEPGFRDNVRNGIAAYAKEAIREWDMLARGKGSSEALEVLGRIVTLYSKYPFRSENEKIFLEESITKINDLLNLRVLRLTAAKAGIHDLLWFVLVIGGVVTIVFTIFFGTENLKAKVLMSTLLAVLIALVLFTILEFSLPFVGSARVSCEPFQLLIARIGT